MDNLDDIRKAAIDLLYSLVATGYHNAPSTPQEVRDKIERLADLSLYRPGRNVQNVVTDQELQ